MTAAERDVFRQELMACAAVLPVEVGAKEVAAFERHAGLLLEWNRRINLTRIVAPAEMAVRHFGESLAVAALIGRDARAVVDVGSGAGFPGVVCAVVRPDLDVVLLEPRGKRAVFLKEVTRGMENVRVQALRLEEWRGEADVLVCRAVAGSAVVEAGRRRSGRGLMLVSREDAASLGLAIHPIPWDTKRVIGVW